MTDARRHIILADDDPILLGLASACLETAGYDVTTAANGEEAWAAIQQHPADLVITDVDMPQMDGLTLLVHIRDTENLANLPVIVITGSEDAEIVDQAFAAGATSFLAKPLNWTLFVQSIKFVLEAADNARSVEEAHRSVREALSIKEAILANLNHEMRTPLNQVIGFGELLSVAAARDGNETYKQQADIIVAGGQRLLGLVRDMTLLSVAETDGLTITASQTTPRDIVEACVSKTKAKAASKKIAVETAGLAGPTSLCVDHDLIIRALTAIADNAVKFSPPETRIVVGFDADPERPGFFCRDEGPGIGDISPEELQKVFVQGNMARDRAHEGMGTGLAIARHVALAHGGEVKMSARATGGLSVCLTLSADRMSEAHARKEKKPWQL